MVQSFEEEGELEFELQRCVSLSLSLKKNLYNLICSSICYLKKNIIIIISKCSSTASIYWLESHMEIIWNNSQSGYMIFGVRASMLVRG